ncbi:hypothetical protein [Streptomyces sp. NPDC093225]|uniref:hypothetical protein n=1 Tax=Streptomyces sp. NPDC093225 TaxID=3366034 RepID=UPI003815B126
MGESERNAEGGKPTITRGSAAWAGLTGGLIGSLVGLAGSVMVYVQADRAREAEAADHRAEVRREAYTDFVADAEAFWTQSRTMRNYLAQFSGDEKDRENLRHHHNELFIPAYDKLVQREAVVKLVGTEPVRQKLAAAALLREQLSDVEWDHYQHTQNAQTATAELNEAIDAHRHAVEAFTTRADDEVL